MTTERRSPVLLAVFAIFAAVLIALTARELLVLFGGFLFALVLRRLSAKISRLVHLPYPVCLAALLVAILASTAAMFVIAGPTLYEQLVALAHRLPAALSDVVAAIRKAPFGRALAPPGPVTAGAVPQTWLSKAFSALGTSLEVVGAIVVIFFVGVYGAARPSDYKRVLIAAFPCRQRRQVLRVANTVARNLTRWLLGRLVAMVFVGVSCGIAFAILDVPLALILAVLAGLLTFVEYVGAVVSAIPPVVLAFTVRPTSALLVLVTFTVLHVIEGYVLTPLLARATVRFPPALTLAAQIVLAALVGPLGLTFSTPLCIVIVSAITTVRGTQQTARARDRK